MTTSAVSAGQVLSGGDVLSGDALEVQNGGVVESLTVLDGGSLVVDDGGSAFQPVVSSGGQMLVSGGGIVTDLVISGVEADFGAGDATTFAGVTLESGVGFRTWNGLPGIEVAAGGVAVGLTVGTSGSVIVDSGGSTSGVILSGPGIIVAVGPGITAPVTSGPDDPVITASVFIQSDGTGLPPPITPPDGGGGGIVTITVTSSIDGGAETVSAGGVAYATSVGAYSDQTVYGSAVGTIVSSGGELVVGSGGFAGDLTVSSGAVLKLQAGARVGGGIVSSGGEVTGLVVSSGTVNFGAGGDLLVDGITLQSGVVLSAGEGAPTIEVASGATALGFVVVSSGAELVDDGGLASGTIISGGGLVTDLGVVSGATVGSGGELTVSSGGVTDGSIVESGGVEAVDFGGTVSGSKVLSGGTEVLSGGSAFEVTVSSGGSVDLEADVGVGQMVSAFVASAATVVSGVTIESGGVADAVSMTIQSGGEVVVASGGAYGETLAVQFGGMVTGGGVLIGATLDKGLVSGVVIGDADPNNYLIVQSGGVASAITVVGGATFGVWAHGAADGVDLLSGAQAFVEIGGSLSGLTLEAGASIDLMGMVADAASSPTPDKLVLTWSGSTVDTITLAAPVGGLYLDVYSDGGGGTNVDAYASAPISAGAEPSLTALNGAEARIGAGDITDVVTDQIPNATLSITSAGLAAGSQSAGSVTLCAQQRYLVFTPAAGFAGSAVVDVTVTDTRGNFVIQPVEVTVLVQASAPIVTPSNTTSTTINGNVTTIQTFSPTGALISTETIAVNGGTTQTQHFNASGTQTSASIQQVSGNVIQLQDFDGNWNQTSVSITTNEGGGDSIVQAFDGAWNQTGAVVTTVNGAVTVVQDFDPNWNQISATYTQVIGNMTEVQDYDAHWNQTAAQLTFNLGGGVTEVQTFDAHWNQTSATITTVNGDQTETQDYNAAWVQVGASIVTVSGGQTTTQTFDANWNQLGVTIDTPNAFGAGTDRFGTYGPTWSQLSETDTAANGGASYFVWGQAGGDQSFTAGASHSTTFIFTPGTLNGDSIAGLHTLNLGGAIHDVIDFEGYGAGAALTQVNATTWSLTSINNLTETFTLAGGALLGDGDYAFVAAGSVTTGPAVSSQSNGVTSSDTIAGGASATLFSQFAAAGGGQSGASTPPLVAASQSTVDPVIAPPS